MKKLGISQAAR
jgi:hypothetical protein